MNTEKDNKQGAQGKHTPGPWVAHDVLWGSDEPALMDRAVYTEDNRLSGKRLIGLVRIINKRGDREDEIATREANARLIAAAPDLLEACEAALLRDDVANDEIGDILRAAIAKATGQ